MTLTISFTFSLEPGSRAGQTPGQVVAQVPLEPIEAEQKTSPPTRDKRQLLWPWAEEYDGSE